MHKVEVEIRYDAEKFRLRVRDEIPARSDYL
jgi:hypothetical protein